MKKSFRDAVTGVLTCHGFMDSNGADIAREEPDDFSLEPGRWRLEEGGWAPCEQFFVPARVTMRQARMALFRADLLSQVSAVIDAIPDETQREAARIEWEFSQTVERRRELTVFLASQLGLSEAQTDELFITAATL